jgi:hypothetical protein
MSFLSTFGGGNPYQLRDFAGNANAFTNTYLRDFTAYNDNFMLIFPNTSSGDNAQGGLWVGNRLNALQKINIFGQAYSYGNNINGCGGDPMVVGAAGFSDFSATNTEFTYFNTDSLYEYEYKDTNSSNTAPSFNYYLLMNAINTNSSSNTQDWSRFMYHAGSQTLYMFKKTNTALYIRRVDSSDNYHLYTPTMTGTTTGWTDNGNNNSAYFNGYWFTMPTYDPTTGDILCYIQNTGNTLGYLIRGGANDTFNITEVGNTQLNSATSTRYVMAAKNANEWALAPEETSDTYNRVYYTTNGGTSFSDTGDGNAAANGAYNSVAYANGYYYSIHSSRDNFQNRQYSGVIRRTTDFSSWENLPTIPVTNPFMLRDNGLGTAAYVGGGNYSSVGYNSQAQVHRVS